MLQPVHWIDVINAPPRVFTSVLLGGVLDQEITAALPFRFVHLNNK